MSVDPHECLSEAFNRIPKGEQSACMDMLRMSFGEELTVDDLVMLEGAQRTTAAGIINPHLCHEGDW